MKCHSCAHPDREVIDRALVAGEPPRRVLAARYGIAKSSLGDHAKNHLSAALRGAIARTTREDGLLGGSGLVARRDGPGNRALDGLGLPPPARVAHDAAVIGPVGRKREPASAVA